MASMTDEDTFRLILQHTYERKENLVQINTRATLAIPTILVAIWGIEGGLDNFRNAWILSFISIGLVLIWRFFAHFIDGDIAKIYIEIVRAENRLGVPDDLSFFNNFMKSITKNQTIMHIDDDLKVKLLEYLKNKNLMGFRGHEKWDFFAFLLIFLFTVSTIFQSIFNTIPIFHPHHLVEFIIISETALIVFSLLIGLVFTILIKTIFQKIAQIQTDPDLEKLKKLCPSLFNEKKTD